MARDQSELLREVLDLPMEARAALAASLIDSLDDEVDENAEADWDSEIRRRVQEVHSGSVKLIPWTEARRRILGK